MTIDFRTRCGNSGIRGPIGWAFMGGEERLPARAIMFRG